MVSLLLPAVQGGLKADAVVVGLALMGVGSYMGLRMDLPAKC